MVLDLDGFKAVNDTRGHAAGDRVLQVVVERAARVVGDDGLVARLGGDEFVLWLHCGGPGAPRTRELLERLRGALAVPVPLADGASARVGASLGVVDADPADPGGRGGDLAAVLAEADRRMYADKRAHRGRGADAGDRDRRAEP
ncbi:diguanylate cyclase [Kineococcus sp. T13]|nr:diguanylate cyclase [Kineococcus vitellinus]